MAGSCGSGIRPSLGSFIAEHVTPRSNSLQRCRFKANFLRCINTAPCGSFEQDSWSDAAIQLPGCSVCFADCGQNVPSLAGKSQAGFGRRVAGDRRPSGMNGFTVRKQRYFGASTERIHIKFQLDTESLEEDKNRLLPLLTHLLIYNMEWGVFKGCSETCCLHLGLAKGREPRWCYQTL